LLVVAIRGGQKKLPKWQLLKMNLSPATYKL
jgi:hypothetical protein